MRDKPADRDRVVAQIAARQHGVVSVSQLLEAGLSRDGIGRRVRGGRLHRLHRGVYAVGHSKISIEGRYMAAVLACGDGAVLSHLSAAAHWRLLSDPSGAVHVTTPDRGGRKRRPGVRLHRSSVLGFRDTRRLRGIPVTSPERTLADLRRTETPPIVRQAARQAAVLGLNIGDEGERDRTRSELERRMLWLFRRHRIPVPEVNARVGEFVVDFLWRQDRVIVEADGWKYHRGRASFEADRSRDAHLRRLGFEVLRFSHRQVFEEPETVLAAISAAIRSPTAGLSRYARQNRRARHDDG